MWWRVLRVVVDVDAIMAAIHGYHVVHVPILEAQQHAVSAGQRGLHHQALSANHKVGAPPEGARGTLQDCKDIWILEHARLFHESDSRELHFVGFPTFSIGRGMEKVVPMLKKNC